jgi:glycosyltransferase involved in cell wall biosynthesis
MKLLYTLTAYPPSIGGAQLHTHLLAREMLSRHSVQVVTQWDSNRSDWLLGTTVRAPGESRDYALEGVHVHRIGLSAREKLRIAPSALAYYPIMRTALRPISACLARRLAPYAEGADLIHNVRVGREGISYASLQIARQRDIPFVFTPLHHPRWVGWRYRAYIDLYAQADLLFALTDTERRTLCELGAQEERVVVIGHGPVVASHADGEAFLRALQIEGPVVLFLGQHFSYKGYRQVLDAAPLVWRRAPETHFVFIGPAVKGSERAFAERVDRRVHRLGKVSLQRKTDALAACTLLCVPSTQESFGGVYTEAWSFGKPVIGCNSPAVAEVISDRVDGYLVEQEPAQIASAICHLLSHPSEAQAMGAAGQRKVRARYTWSQIAARAEQAYRTVIHT